MVIKTRVKLLIGIFIILLILDSCTKYRDLPCKDCNFVAPPAGTISWGTLRINEFICKGLNAGAQSTLQSDAKWFEIYNPTTANVTLDAGKWFVTDDNSATTKYAIPAVTSGSQWFVPALGYLVIMCPKIGTTTPSPIKINASFSLSSTLGDIGIFYQATPSSAVIAIDTISYNFPSGALDGVSYGRNPDGQGSINQLSKVTAETSNN